MKKSSGVACRIPPLPATHVHTPTTHKHHTKPRLQTPHPPKLPRPHPIPVVKEMQQFMSPSQHNARLCVYSCVRDAERKRRQAEEAKKQN